LIRDGDINAASVVSEVRDAFERYEADLRAHDVTALDTWFLNRTDTVRYGVAEHNYGAEAIGAWRRAALPVDAGRQLLRLTIVAFGADAASVSAEFTTPGKSLRLRQSQFWLRHESGWKIGAAHVSEIAAVLLAN
jgi:hypothetical protein